MHSLQSHLGVDKFEMGKYENIWKKTGTRHNGEGHVHQNL